MHPKSVLTCFHTDNGVSKTDALDRKSTVYTLMMSAFQKKPQEFPIPPLDVFQGSTTQTLKKNSYNEKEFCDAPKLTKFQLPERCAAQLPTFPDGVNLVKEKSLPWLLSKSLLGYNQKEDVWTSIDTEINIDLEETPQNITRDCKIFVNDSNKMYEEDNRHQEVLESDSAAVSIPQWSAFHSRVV